MSSIDIYGAICPTKRFDTERIRQITYEHVRETYLQGSFWYKILWFFGEKEIKQHEFTRIQKEYTDTVTSNIFSHEERNAYVHRCNIAYHYPLNTTSTPAKELPTITDTTLNALCNDFLLGVGMFAGVPIQESISVLETQIQHLFITDTPLHTFAKKHCTFPKQHMGCDIVTQLKVYKANILLAQAILDPTQQDVTIQTFISDFIERYHEIPLAMRTLGISNMEPGILQKLRDPAQYDSLKEICTPIYSITVQSVPPCEPMGVVHQRNMYTGYMAKIGMVWKAFPWRLKVIIILFLYGGTAYFGAWAVFILPLIVFGKQYAKTKADLAESTKHHIQSVAQQHGAHMQQRIALEDIAYENTDNLTTQKKAKKMLRERYETLPLSLFSRDTMCLEDFVIKMTKLLIEPQKTIETKDNLESVLAQVLSYFHIQQRYGIPTIPTKYIDQKESFLLRLYKTIVVSSAAVGRPLHTAISFDHIKQLPAYTDSYETYNNDVVHAKKNYIRTTTQYAGIDSIMTATIVRVTGWTTSMLFASPSTTASVAFAAQTGTKITLDKDSPLWEFLKEHDISDTITQNHSLDEVARIIDFKADYTVSNNQILHLGQTHLDEKISTSLDDILPETVRTDLLQRIQEGTTEHTLWDTMVAISGYTDGNQYVQRLVDELWKADTDGVSELFSSALHNGIAVDDIADKDRDHIIRVLEKIYGYPGFENYAQRIDKQRLYDRFNEINDGTLSLDALKDFTLEQRSVLSHAAFTHIDENDLQELFFDTKNEVVGTLQHIPATSDTIIQTGADTSSGASQSFFDTFNFKFDRGIKAIPLPRGKNRIMPKIKN